MGWKADDGGAYEESNRCSATWSIDRRACEEKHGPSYGANSRGSSIRGTSTHVSLTANVELTGAARLYRAATEGSEVERHVRVH